MKTDEYDSTEMGSPGRVRLSGTERRRRWGHRLGRGEGLSDEWGESVGSKRRQRSVAVTAAQRLECV